ncbi:AAA family ATPase [Deltaproteobacteria bacterium OttesenSCG-928-M10]|nr:AAA family ATPase [Deltaproteobacteria bacterium OttesenSCG-928-M10]
MRLKALTIKNFKGIDELGVRIDFAPITLLFGANNVGKSTIIQALHLAREVFCGAIPDKIEASRHGVELGSFKDYVHRHEMNRVIQIGFSFDTETEKLFVGKRIGVEISVSWNNKLNRAELAEYAVLVNDKKFAAWTKTAPVEILESEKSKKAVNLHAESFLCIYDTTPLIPDADMQKLKAVRDALAPRLAEAESVEQAHLVFKSAEWAEFLKSYFEAIPDGLYHVSNVNTFLKYLDIGTKFLNDSGIDELYEKSFYSTEKKPAKIDVIYKRLLEEFPGDAGLIKGLIKKCSDAKDVFSQLVVHFQNDFDSLKRLCKYSPGTFSYFADYYENINLDVDQIRQKMKYKDRLDSLQDEPL